MMFARASELATEGCKLDLVEDCLETDSGVIPETRLGMVRRLCRLDRSYCGWLANTYERQSRYEEGRDERERACQYSDAIDQCLTLGVAYLEQRYVEPVKGRGQALVDKACVKMQRILRKSEKLAERVPECKYAKLK